MKIKFTLLFRLVKDFLLWILLSLFGRNIKLATSWNELSALQLKEVANALEYYHKFSPLFPDRSKPRNFSRLYVNLVKQLLRSNNMFKVWYALRQIPPEHYESYVKFLIGENNRTKFLPAFKFKGKTYHPPGSRLQNLSIKEFSFADSLFYNWRKSNDDRYLDLLCATLYRNSSGEENELDSRKPFSKILVEKDAAHFKKLNYKRKLAIAYCYEGSRNYITKQYPHIFPKPPKQTEEEKKKKRKQPPIYVPFLQLLQHKIKFDPSKLEITQNLNIHEFFSTYENELKDLKKQKK